MENLKIEKGKTYTYEEIKEIYKKAMMLSGIVILHTMEDNMFEKEENEDE